MATRSETIDFLRKTVIFKKVGNRTEIGFIVYTGINDLNKIVSKSTDTMNEVRIQDIDDNDSFVYFPQIAGVDACHLIGSGLSNTPDTIIFELGRMVHTLRNQLRDMQYAANSSVE